MQRGRRTCPLFLAAAAVMVGAVAPPALGTSYALRNSAPVPTEPLASAGLTFSCLPWTTGPITGSVSFANALKHARALVKPSSARFHKLQHLQFLDKPVHAEGAAAMAILKGSPKGALAGLLASLEEKPNDPVLLMDAGVLLIKLGLPRESLAFIVRATNRPAPPANGLQWPALLKANRALAYVALQRYDLAASYARQALQRSPWLVEARETLAAALFCGGNQADGICELRAAQRRPLEEDEGPLSCAAAITRALRDGDFGDLQNGPKGVIPNVPTPVTAEVSPDYLDTYSAMNAAIDARGTTRSSRLVQLITFQDQWAAKVSPATQQRTTDLVAKWTDTPTTSPFKEEQDNVIALRDEVVDLVTDTGTQLTQFLVDCAPDDDPVACTRAKCYLKQTHGVWLNDWNELNLAVRDYWKALHARLRGIQRGVESAPWNEHMAILTEQLADDWVGVLIDSAMDWSTLTSGWKAMCLDPPIEEPPAPPDTETDTPTERCPAALQAMKAGISLDAGEILPGPGPAPKAGITLKCSSIEFSLSWSPLPLLTGYGKLSVGFGPQGTTTLSFGSKAGAKGVNFVSEIAVTADAKGNLRDMTWNVGPKKPFGKQDIVSIPIVGSATGPPVL